MNKGEHISFHEQISRNKRNSVFLIAVIFIVFLALALIIGMIYQADFFFILIAGIIIAMVYILAGYYGSDKIAIASTGAVPADPNKYRMLHHSVESMAIASGLPKPKVYVMNSPQINAFATGKDPDRAVVCVTTGALEKLDKQELEGVIGHELSHVANYDIRFMTLTVALVGMIAIISEIFLRSLWFRSNDRNNGKGNALFLILGIILAILAPIFVQLVQLAISRKREYAADATSVKFTRYPRGLISALKKIKSDAPMKKGQVTKAVSSLFMNDPYKRDLSDLFATHPAIDKRISALERM